MFLVLATLAAPTSPAAAADPALAVTSLGKLPPGLSSRHEQQGTPEKWEKLRTLLAADADRVIISQLAANLGGNTSIRSEAPLVWKDKGYFRRARDLGQVFTAPCDFTLDAIILRTGNDYLAFLPGAANAEVFVQFFEVKGAPVIDDNATPPGAAAKHGFSANHRCDDFITGVQYLPIRVFAGAALPDLAAEGDARLTYLKFAFAAPDAPRFRKDKRYAFLLGFVQPAPDRNFTLANRNNAASPRTPSLTDADDTYHGGWSIRREGNGKNPPLMIPAPQPPADMSILRKLQAQSAFPTGPARYAATPTSDGYPDVDTYRDLEFYIITK